MLCCLRERRIWTTDNHLHLKVSACAEGSSWQENPWWRQWVECRDLEPFILCSHVFVSPLGSHASALPCLAQARKQNCWNARRKVILMVFPVQTEPEGREEISWEGLTDFQPGPTQGRGAPGVSSEPVGPELSPHFHVPGSPAAPEWDDSTADVQGSPAIPWISAFLWSSPDLVRSGVFAACSHHGRGGWGCGWLLQVGDFSAGNEAPPFLKVRQDIQDKTRDFDLESKPSALQ